MKLAFSGDARYTDFSEGYSLYVNRSRNGLSVDRKTYSRIIRKYCKLLADRLIENGIVDLPAELGSIAAATITRKPQYRGDKFIGYGKMDWKTGHYDGKLKTFGMVYLPRRNKTNNLRSFGYVANRKLFNKMKNHFHSDHCQWQPIVYNDEMI